MNEPLNPSFLSALFASMIQDKLVMEACAENLRYTFLPTEEYKEVWRVIKTHFQEHGTCIKTPVLEQEISQNNYPRKGSGFKNNCLGLIDEIKWADSVDREEILPVLQEYIKRALFHESYLKGATLFKNGEFDQAFSMYMEKAQEINDFSLLPKKLGKVLDGFKDRMEFRKTQSTNPEFGKKHFRVPTGIHQLDDAWGGIENGAMLLIQGNVNEGKSTMLRHLAEHAALTGHTVIHFQAEDSEHVAMTLYDASIMRQGYRDIAFGNFELAEVDSTVQDVVQKALELGGEIHIDVQGKFAKYTLSQCRKKAYELLKEVDQIHFAVFDYFEKFHPSTGKKYPGSYEGEGRRRSDLGQEMKNFALEFNCAVAAATQSRDIGDKKDDPNYRKTEKDLGEYKKGHEAFTYGISLNQTADQADENFMNLHTFKGRFDKKGFDVPIYTAFHRHKMYDAQRTCANLYDEYAREQFMREVQGGGSL